MWQHVQFSEQICPQDALACCRNIKQPANKNSKKHWDWLHGLCSCALCFRYWQLCQPELFGSSAQWVAGYSRKHWQSACPQQAGPQVWAFLSFSLIMIMIVLKGAVQGAGIAQLVVLGLAVHSVAGSILLWGHFPVEGISPLELTWVQTPFPQRLLQMRV